MKYILLFLFLCVNMLSFGQKFHSIPEVDLDNLIDGWYKFTTNTAIFDVEISNNKMTQGIITWLDESSYSGKLQNNILSGKGTYTWPNGMRYEGSFKNNMRHGKGSLILQNGVRWYGKWRENKKDGKGRVYSPEGKITKVGVWKNDVFIEEKT